MSQPDCLTLLRNMQDLIRKGRKHFVRRNRNGKSYLQQLLDLGLTDIDEAWQCVLDLNDTHYHSGPSYDNNDIELKLGKVVWVFKMEINDCVAYIKLKDETENRGCVCISFHEDEP